MSRIHPKVESASISTMRNSNRGAGARGIAIVAVPRLELFVVTERGQVRVPEEEHDAMLADFFDGARTS